MLASGWQYLRLAARSLLRVPVFALAVVASLGISVAAVTTVFSVADAVLFRALPFRAPDELVWITSVRPQRSDAPFSLPEFMDYSARARTVDIAAYTTWSASLATLGVARRLQGMRISGNAFDVLGVTACAGRLLHPADDRPEAARVVVLSHSFWLDHFAGDPKTVGQTIRLNDQSHQIVGVMPRYFPLPLPNVDVLVPLSPDLDARRHLRSSTNFLRLLGRLREPGSLAAAKQDLTGIAHALRTEFPGDYANKLDVAITPLQESLVGNTREMFVVMLGAAALLLVTALASVLNLLLVRGVAKQGEVAVRRALGGTGRHLAYGAISESALLSVVGTLSGALAATWLVSLIANSSLTVLRIDESRVSGRALLLVTAISILATLLFSAIQLLSSSRAVPWQRLSAVGRGVYGSRGEARLRGTFLVAQLALAVLLTIVTTTMSRSFARLQALDLGYRPDSVYVARLALPPQKYRSVADLGRFTQTLHQTLRNSPGVIAAGAISIAPLSGSLYIIPFTVAGRPAVPGERPEANLRAITPGYLTAIGATVLAGRDLAFTDNDVAIKAALISRALAQRYFGNTDPLGQQLLVNDNNTGPRPVSIVGVVDNMRHVSVDGPAAFDIYIPMAQVHSDGLGVMTGSQFWVVRIASARADYTRSFASALQAIDKDVAMARGQSLRTYVDESLSARRISVLVLTGFALVALLLAMIGVYGVVAYSVKRRRREIGLRMALGATSFVLTRSFIAPALRLALVGVAIGVSGALLTSGIVSGLLFGITPADPATLGLVALALVLTSALAAAIPAQRASRIDPVVAIQNE